jgi:hypothetical protein
MPEEVRLRRRRWLKLWRKCISLCLGGNRGADEDVLANSDIPDLAFRHKLLENLPSLERVLSQVLVKLSCLLVHRHRPVNEVQIEV